MKTVVRTYIGFQFFFQMMVWLPIFYEYQVRIGISPEQIFQIQSFYYIAFCFLEIPTGLIADRLGYLRCLRAGAVVLIVSNLLPIFAQSTLGMVLHFFGIALSRSLISGASSAYLYDYLAAQGQVALYKEVEGKARSYGLIGKVIAWAGIGTMMNGWLTIPYWLTTLSAVISVVYAVKLPALAPYTQKASRAIHLHIGESLKQVALKPALLLIMLQGVGLFVLGRIVQVNLFQPILAGKNFDVAAFGWVMSIMTIFEAFGSHSPGRIRKWLGDLNAVHVLTFGIAATLALLPLANHGLTVALLCIFSVIVGVSFPIQKQLINDAITDSTYRATLLSIESIVDRAVCAWVAALLAQFLANPSGLERFLYWSAAATAIGAVVLIICFAIVSRSSKKSEVTS